jgi:SAM-dependent methyltransferase
MYDRSKSVSPEAYLEARILAEVPAESLVLDVGAGMAKYHEALLGVVAPRVDQLVLLDAHAPYLAERATCFAQEIEANRVMLLHGEALPVLRTIDDTCLDVALAIDFLEHLAMDAALSVMDEMKRIVKPGGKVVVFVPEGDHPQDKDHFNSGGDHWQTHRSKWEWFNLVVSLGMENEAVERWPDFHAGTPGKDEGALWGVWTKAKE